MRELVRIIDRAREMTLDFSLQWSDVHKESVSAYIHVDNNLIHNTSINKLWMQ